MTEFIPRAKAESLASYIPGLLNRILLSGDDAEFILISSEGVLSTEFDVAVIEDGAVSYISDDSRKAEVEAFLTHKTMV